MKVTINEEQKKHGRPFPKLMISSKTGSIVLFSESRVGTQLKKFCGTGCAFSECATDWNMEHFTDFNGSVTLSND